MSVIDGQQAAETLHYLGQLGAEFRAELEQIAGSGDIESQT